MTQLNNLLENKKFITVLGILVVIAGVFLYKKTYANMNYPELNEPAPLDPVIPSAGTPAPSPTPSGVPGTKNFSLSEFHCKDGTKVPKEYYSNLQRLMNNLQVLRDHLGVSILINSGYRSPTHNAKVGGAKNSTHKRALAADIRTNSHTPAQIKSKITELIAAGKMEQGGIGLYPTFVHYDVRGYKARW